MNEAVEQEKPTTEGTAKIVYILYLVGIIFGITGIIGVVIAYIYKDDAPQWLKTHYQFLIRTFWIGAFYMLITVIIEMAVMGHLMMVIGYLVLLFLVVWLIVRCVKGMKSLDQKKAHPNPTGWMF